MPRTKKNPTQEVGSYITPRPSESVSQKNEKPVTRSRAWVFTCNNYTADDEELIRNIGAQYGIYGYEVGEKNGTPHLQGNLYFASQRTWDSLNRKCPRFWFAKMRGTMLQATDYSSKDKNFVEWGNRPMSNEERGQMERDRYEAAWTLAKEGKIDEIDPDIRVRHYNTLKNIRKDYQAVPESISKLDFHWFWGPTGAGKSRQARAENPDAYIKKPSKWWDGYVDQPCVIIDEWSPAHSYLSPDLKTWCDHYAFQADTKGGMVCIRPPKIIITSNYSMEQCFSGCEELEPLRRRFKVTRFGPEPEPVPQKTYIPDILKI